MAYLLVEKFYNFLRVSNNENAISIISGSAKKKKKNEYIYIFLSYCYLVAYNGVNIAW